MDRLFPGTAPAKLYAFLLKVRPLEEGTVMPFSGELIHAAWLRWLEATAPEVAHWLHDGNKRRLFTCSSLQFPLSAARVREAERENIHLPVSPEQTYTIRITLLLGELFPLFHEALTNFQQQQKTEQPPFMRIGKHLFLLEEVVGGEDDGAGWTGFTSFAQLVEQAKNARPGKAEPLILEFDSLTTFSRGSQNNKAYGGHHARLPLPEYVFTGLARRWQELAPPELAGLVQMERVEQYCRDEGIIIVDYHLRTHQLKFTNHPQSGFLGTCKYLLRGPDEPTTSEAPLTVRQQLLLLAQLAFYTGVGYKTAMGMGRTRVVEKL
ncbi:MAG TPA: CRISPR system precrRNA processing endoribonuclease RAMP protein Cas6 [Ktedonobacteraceae bacterium]|nr:CRISPR system precrRNA processing endoribonuclease RAMP protein Cas6 [Ktedonobacteraceae bacterium]